MRGKIRTRKPKHETKITVLLSTNDMIATEVEAANKRIEARMALAASHDPVVETALERAAGFSLSDYEMLF